MYFAGRAEPRRKIGQCGVAVWVERADIFQTCGLPHLSAWSTSGSRRELQVFETSASAQLDTWIEDARNVEDPTVVAVSEAVQEQIDWLVGILGTPTCEVRSNRP